MRRADRLAVRRYGIPGLLLMENAGRAVAEGVRKLQRDSRQKRIILLCGGGNNGGDGIVAARYLHDWGCDVQVFWVNNPKNLQDDAGRHYQIARRTGVRFKSFVGIPMRRRVPVLRRASILVDALLGTGTKGKIRDPYRQAILSLNAARRPIVAVDIPSGLDADTGKPLGLAVKARLTVTMAAAKTGLVAAAAKPFVGKLIVADIGIPRKIL